MWSDRPVSTEDVVGRYWDDLVSGVPHGSGDDATGAIDPTLAQTIAVLERLDDAQPASAEFSRRFEDQFLQAIGAVPSLDAGRVERPTGELIEFPDHRNPQKGNHRGLPLPAEDSRGWSRIQVSLVAAAVLIVSLVAIYYAIEHRGGTRDTNVILAPSTSIDVPMDRGNAQRSGVMPGPGVESGLESIWQFAAGRSGISAPAVVGDTVFITSGSEIGGGSEDQGSIIAVDGRTGSERWRFPTDHATGSTPAVAGGIVYVGDTGGIVYALDASTGAEIWRRDLQSGWTSAPVVVDDTVYIAVAPYQAALHVAAEAGTVVVGSALASQPGNGFGLYAIDRRSGAERWHSADDRFTQPGLFAFDTGTGVLMWQFDMSSLEAGPAISGQRVYAGSSLDGNFYALDLATGAEEWIAPIGQDLPSNSSPAVYGGNVIVTTAFGSIVCLDSSSGAERWRASAEHISLNSSAIVVDSVVYVVDTNWGVSALSTADGSVLWSEQLALSGQVVVSPVIVNGTLYIGTSLEPDSAYVATLWAFEGSGDTNRAAS